MDLYGIKTMLAAGKTIFDLPLRCTYYARVSTDKDEQAHSLKAQVEYYEQYIRSFPNWSFAPGYVDEGISGTSVARREAFLMMIKDAERDKFDLIITKEISRFSRSTLDSVGYTQKLLGYGVGVFFQSDNINTLTPDAELRLTIMASIAQDEVRKISERVKFGHRRSIEKGVVLGNDSIWGYRKEKGRLVIVEEEAEIVREIFQLYALGGLGVRRVCDELTRQGRQNTNGRPFSFTTVRNILSNPKYKGYYCGGKTTKVDYRMSWRKRIDPKEWVEYRDYGSVPPIVSEELWERANEILKARSESQSAADRTSYNNKYAYSGLISCRADGEPFYRAIYRYGGEAKEVWQCRRFVKKGRAGCVSPKLYSGEIDHMLRDGLDELMGDKFENIADRMIGIYLSAAESREMGREGARAEAELAVVAARKDKLLDLLVAGIIGQEEFAMRNAAFNEQLARQQNLVAKACGEREKAESMLRDIKGLKEAILREITLPDGLDNRLASSIIEKIEAGREEDTGEITVDMSIKGTAGVFRYGVARRRGKPSVCTRLHI